MRRLENVLYITNYDSDDFWGNYTNYFKRMYDLIYAEEIKSSEEYIKKELLKSLESIVFPLLEDKHLGFSEMEKIYCEIMNSVGLLRIKLKSNKSYTHKFACQLRECNSFYDFKYVVETNGVNFIKFFVNKNDINITLNYTKKDDFFKRVNYILSLSLYTEFLKENAFHPELSDYVSKLFRYDFLNNGYPLYSLPNKTIDNLDMERLSNEIELHIINFGCIPKELSVNMEYHMNICASIVNGIASLPSIKDKDLQRAHELIMDSFDCLVMESTCYFEEKINEFLNEVDSKNNYIIEEIHSNSSKYISIEAIIELEKTNLLYEELIYEYVEYLDKSMSNIKLYRIYLATAHHRLNIEPTQKLLNKVLKMNKYMDSYSEFIFDLSIDRVIHELFDRHKDLKIYIRDFIRKYNNSKLEKEYNIASDTFDKEVYKLLDYRKLNQIAEENGFKKVRQNGSHGIFRKRDGKVIVIPQAKKIGKGLNIKIQKDISDN